MDSVVLSLAERQSLLNSKTAYLEYKVSQTPYILSEKVYKKLARNCELVINALEAFLRVYVESKEVQSLYPELAAYRELTCFKPQSKHWIHFARFDLIETEGGEFKILEVNTGWPGSTFYTFVTQAIAKLAIPPSQNVLKFRLDNPNFLPESLMELSKEVLGKESPNVAFLFDSTESKRLEVRLYEKVVKEYLNCTRTQLMDLKSSRDGSVYAGDMAVDLVYHRLDRLIDENGQASLPLFTCPTEEKEVYLKGVRNNEIVLVNNPASYLVAENKKTIALFTRPELQNIFTTKQQEAIRELIPETHCFDFTNQPKYEAMAADFIKNKSNWVIKATLSSRSREVWIGKDCAEDEWAKLVQKLRSEPYIIQRYIPQIKTAVLNTTEQPKLEPMYTVTAVYILRGKADAVLCRSSPEAIVSVNKKGCLRKVWVCKS